MLSKLLDRWFRVKWDSTPQVIVLKKARALYFPIPKVACSSWKKVCAATLGLTIPPGKGIHHVRFPTVSLDQVHRFRRYFKFCFVRNPWDRLVSCYSEKIKQDPNYNLHGFERGIPRAFARFKVFHATMSFDSFVEAVVQIPDDDANLHFKSQAAFVTDREGRLLVDFVGKLEHAERDFAYVIDRLHLGTRSVPHLNKSVHRDYRTFYTDRTIEMVRRRYQKDIELFGYDFDGSEKTGVLAASR
jgi:hypothetical protein